MPHAKPLRLGFIGGSVKSAVGATHRIASAMDKKFELVSGCFSRDHQTNMQTAETWAVPLERVYRDLFEMLEGEKDRIDAVCVLTPVGEHASIIAACLDSGFNVISEKPLAGSISDCEVISAACERSGRHLAVTMNYTGYPMVRELRRRIEEGQFGSIISVRMTMQQEGYLRRDQNGLPVRPQAWRLIDGEIPTVSLDLGAHLIHMLKFLLGHFPQRVFSRMNSLGSFKGLVDDVDVLMEMADGKPAHAWWGKSALGYPNGLSVEVFGSEKSARWIQMDPEILRIADSAGVEYRIHRGSRDNLVAGDPRYNRFKAGHPDGFIEAFANCYSDIADEIRSVIEGHPTPNDFVCRFLDGSRTIEVLSSISLSAREEQWRHTHSN